MFWNIELIPIGVASKLGNTSQRFCHYVWKLYLDDFAINTHRASPGLDHGWSFRRGCLANARNKRSFLSIICSDKMFKATQRGMGVRKLCYIWTSTDERCTDRQIDRLNDVCDEVFIEDGVSAISRKRPVFDSVMQELRSGDVFVVSSQDRAFRSSTDALLVLEKLQKRDSAFLSLSQNFDTTTPDGKFLYTMAAALATWERDILSLRTKEGLQSARKRGNILGRPRKLTPSQTQEARDKLNSHQFSSTAQAAKHYNVHERTLIRALRDKG